jgi:Raf kinase inhibitor-like YbhB/YbcL family protein
LVAGCGGGSKPPAAPATLTLRSPAFADGGTIPVRFTCASRGLSPPLRWSGVPRGARELVLLVEDPDAPGGAFVHWVVYDIPPGVTHIPADADARHALPQGAVQGKNTKGQRGWSPVCPPPPSLHHYHFAVFALDDTPTLSQPTQDDLMHAMHGHILAEGEIVGTFQRQGH